ncbi:hypothetical protein [Helicobacter pylori]|nr:hypothetical protein [Helicobacter pylori]
MNFLGGGGLFQASAINSRVRNDWHLQHYSLYATFMLTCYFEAICDDD